MTAYTAANLILVRVGPLVGRALDVISIRWAVVAGAVVMATGLAVASLVHQFWLLLVVFGIIVPVGGAFAGVLPATVMGVRMFPERTGLINGLIGLGSGFSLAIIAAFATVMIDVAGWRGAFLVAAAVIGAVVAPAAFWLLDIAAGAPAKTLMAAAGDSASSEGFTVLKQPVFWVLVLATLPIMMVLTSIASSLAPIVSDSGIDRARTAIIVSIFPISSSVGGLIGGWLADQLGPRTFYAGFFGALAAGLTIMAQRPGLYMLGATMVLLGFAGGSIIPWAAAMVMRRFGAQSFARAFGLLMAFFVFAAVAPILFGRLRDQTGSYQAGFLVLLMVLAPGLLTLILLRPAALPALAPQRN